MVKMNELYRYLYGLSFTRMSTIIWGMPGVGKSAIIKKLAEDTDRRFVHLFASQQMREDLPGIPVLDKDKQWGAVSNYTTPKFIVDLYGNDDKKSILFLDELGTADEDMQKYFLSILNEGKSGSHQLDLNRTWRVAASNFVDTRGNAELSEAMNDRLCHLFVEYDVKQNGIMEMNDWSIDTSNLPKISDEKDWLVNFKKYVVLRNKFLDSHPNWVEVINAMTNKFNPGHQKQMEALESGDERVDYTSYISSRSLTNLLKVWSILGENDMDFMYEISSGIVGPAFAGDWTQFLKLNNFEFSFDPDKHIGKENKVTLKTLKVDIDRIDIVETLIQACRYYYKRDPGKYEKLVVRIFNIIINSNNRYGDYAGISSYAFQYMREIISIYLESNPNDFSRYKELYESFDYYRDHPEMKDQFKAQP